MNDIVERIREALRQDTFWDADAPPLLEDAVAEIERLREAIRRFAAQDATLSLLCKRDGSQVVTVTMDGTLTAEEREALQRDIEWLEWCQQNRQIGEGGQKDLAVLRAMLERLA